MVILDDLFFEAKIRETARLLSVEVIIVKTKEDLERELKTEKIEKIIADLNFRKFDLFEELVKIKKSYSLEIVGYLSHVQHDLKKKAEMSCSKVMARSEFSVKLPELLSI